MEHVPLIDSPIKKKTHVPMVSYSLKPPFLLNKFPVSSMIFPIKTSIFKMNFPAISDQMIRLEPARADARLLLTFGGHLLLWRSWLLVGPPKRLDGFNMVKDWGSRIYLGYSCDGWMGEMFPELMGY